MIIISDTTPLHYLIEIDEQDLLKKLFGQVILPQGVTEELSHPKAPQKVKDWVQNLPDWIEVRTADATLFQPQKENRERRTPSHRLSHRNESRCSAGG